jgi:hypothetical protein
MSDYTPLVLQFLVVLADEVTADAGLEEGDDACKTLITHVFQFTQHSGTEEDLSVTELVLVLVHLQSHQHLLSHHLGINEALWDGVGSQDGVAVHTHMTRNIDCDHIQIFN